MVLVVLALGLPVLWYGVAKLEVATVSMHGMHTPVCYVEYCIPKVCMYMMCSMILRAII